MGVMVLAINIQCDLVKIYCKNSNKLSLNFFLLVEDVIKLLFCSLSKSQQIMTKKIAIHVCAYTHQHNKQTGMANLLLFHFKITIFIFIVYRVIITHLLPILPWQTLKISIAMLLITQGTLVWSSRDC